MSPDTAVVPAADAGEVIDTGDGYVDQGQADLEAQAALLEQLNPCRLCGKMQSAGPTRGEHNAPHCWACGYRPGAAPSPGAVLSTVGPGLSPSQVDAALAELRRGIVEDLVALGAVKTPEGEGTTVTAGAGEA